MHPSPAVDLGRYRGHLQDLLRFIPTEGFPQRSCGFGAGRSLVDLPGSKKQHQMQGTMQFSVLHPSRKGFLGHARSEKSTREWQGKAGWAGRKRGKKGEHHCLQEEEGYSKDRGQHKTG